MADALTGDPDLKVQLNLRTVVYFILLTLRIFITLMYSPPVIAGTPVFQLRFNLRYYPRSVQSKIGSVWVWVCLLARRDWGCI